MSGAGVAGKKKSVSQAANELTEGQLSDPWRGQGSEDIGFDGIMKNKVGCIFGLMGRRIL